MGESSGITIDLASLKNISFEAVWYYCKISHMHPSPAHICEILPCEQNTLVSLKHLNIVVRDDRFYFVRQLVNFDIS